MSLSDSCWIWTEKRHPCGYGVVSKVLAHRLAYQMFRGPIPAGLQLDHVCRQRGCVNPAHLRPVTIRENVLAPGSRSPQAVNRAKTHCVRGHAFDEANTYRWKNKRLCLTCMWERERQRPKRTGYYQAYNERRRAKPRRTAPMDRS